jgi:hypothetical protein
VKVLNNCLAQTEATTTTDTGGAGGGVAGKFDDQTIMECMHLARLQIEQFGDMDLGPKKFLHNFEFIFFLIAESRILKAISLSNGTWLSGRCHLLLAMIYRLIFIIIKWPILGPKIGFFYLGFSGKFTK